jgi:glycosyltransferase involved in cell wall biosynthesis
MAVSPVLSLVIPTRERSDTLAYTLRAAVAQQTQSFEVLVCDNLSEDDTPQVVARVNDSRVRYVRTNDRLSMCDNWEFALKHARGRYVLYIGDDDAVLPNGIDHLCALMVSEPSRAYMWTAPIYTWPIETRSPELTYLPTVPLAHRLDLRAIAAFVIRHGGWRINFLPGAYHAAIERELLLAIERRVGRVFRSTQPDLYTSMAVAAMTPDAIHTGRPITIHGRSAKSNGGFSLVTNGAAVMQRYIDEFGRYQTHPALGNVLPEPARLIIDAILVARDDFPNVYGDIPFDYSVMLAFLCKLGFTSEAFVLTHRNSFRHSPEFSLPRFLAYAAAFKGAKLRRLLLNRFGNRGPFTQEVPTNVYEFARQYSEWIENTTINP